jgi:uncharacterized protein YkwD
MARINQVRAAGADCGSEGKFAPAPALAWNALLTQSAEVHSQDMSKNNFFDHTGSDGRTFDKRIAATGYLMGPGGENIAVWYDSVESVMQAWMGSPGHCAGIMSSSFTDVGVSCVLGKPGDDYPRYWTMDLAAKQQR